jgi:hypothetical protein
MNPEKPIFRNCLRQPIPEIAAAAQYLDKAVSAHLIGDLESAKELFLRADMPVIRNWTESLWGKNSPYVTHYVVANAPPSIPKHQRVVVRMPTPMERQELHKRDGYHCRFCGIPVIRMEIRDRIREVYPEAVPWGRTNISQHAAFQAMWAQYDHLLPHARGGNNNLENLVVTCAPCNFGRGDSTLDEVGLLDPRTREPVRSSWDGLERFCLNLTANTTNDEPKRSWEMCSPDGKEDAFIHDFILDNPEADKAFQDEAIRRAVAGGMSLEMAHALYGNGTKRKPGELD